MPTPMRTPFTDRAEVVEKRMGLCGHNKTSLAAADNAELMPKT